MYRVRPKTQEKVSGSTEKPGPGGGGRGDQGWWVMHGAGARGVGERCFETRGGEWTRVRDGPGRTHKTLVEADQPRLPMVVENQNRLNHLCWSRFPRHQLLQESSHFRHNTGTSGWCLALNCPPGIYCGALGSEHRRVRPLWRPGEHGCGSRGARSPRPAWLSIRAWLGRESRTGPLTPHSSSIAEPTASATWIQGGHS